MNIIEDAEAAAANAIVPGSGILVKLWGWIKPMLPWLLLAAGIAAAIWGFARHFEVKGAETQAAKDLPALQRALAAEQTAIATIGRLRSGIDAQNTAERTLASAEAVKLTAAQAALEAARAHDKTRAAQVARLTADASRALPGAPCEATETVKDLWK